jgi:hypothetical protein
MEIEEKIKREISGVKPKVISRYCDLCNDVLSDYIYLFGYLDGRNIRFSKATHLDCDVGLSDSGINFKVKCEIMEEKDEYIVLGNPEIEKIND